MLWSQVLQYFEFGGKFYFHFSFRYSTSRVLLLAITTVDTNTEAFSRTARLTTHTDTAVACTGTGTGTAVHSLHIKCIDKSVSTSLIVGRTDAHIFFSKISTSSHRTFERWRGADRALAAPAPQSRVDPSRHGALLHG